MYLYGFSFLQKEEEIEIDILGDQHILGYLYKFSTAADRNLWLSGCVDGARRDDKGVCKIIVCKIDELLYRIDSVNLIQGRRLSDSIPMFLGFEQYKPDDASEDDYIHSKSLGQWLSTIGRAVYFINETSRDWWVAEHPSRRFIIKYVMPELDNVRHTRIYVYRSKRLDSPLT